MQSPRPTLFLTCGLPGSGKTALARRLEAEVPALRLTADEWLHEFYPTITTAEAEEGTFRGRVERVQWPLALRALQLGCDVVLDWGLWSREERDLYRTGARDAGARVVLCLLDPSVDELCGRLARRNADRPFGAFEISKEDLLRWAKLFQRPTDEELELYDNWQADCDSPRSSLAWPARFGVQSQMAPFGRGRGRLPMGTQGAQPQVQDAAVASGATRKAPLALQILCLIWAAFIIVENVGQIRWNWPTGSSLPGGTIGLRRADILGDGYVRINVMKPGGPMARAGVAPGDKVRFDRPYDRVRRLQVGESVGFTLVRAGRPAHMQVTAEHRTTAPETTGLARLSLL